MIDLYYTINHHSVTVTKSFSGRTALPEDFAITNSYNSDRFTLSNSTGGTGTAADPFTWTLSGVPYGVPVTFQEEGADDESTSGYKLTASVAVNGTDGSTATIPDDKNTVVAFTNTYGKVFEELNDEINGDSFEIHKTGYRMQPLAGAKFELADSTGKVVWTGTTPADGVLTVEIEEEDILDPKDVSAERTYTLRETQPEGYQASGPWTVTLVGADSESGTTAGGKFYHIYDWTVASVTEDSDALAQNLLDAGTLKVHNLRMLGDLTVSKEVTGLDPGQKAYTFTITASEDLDGIPLQTSTGSADTFQGSTATFTLTNGQSIEIYNLPTGVYQISEDTADAQISGYDLTVTYLDSDQDNTADSMVSVFQDATGMSAEMSVTNAYTIPVPPSDPTPPGQDHEELPDEEPPLEELPDEEPPLEELPDEDPPLADAPATGDNLIAWVLAAAVSGLGLIWLALAGKKRKDENV